MIKLVITDIGGVMVKTDEAIITTIRQVFEKNSIPIGEKQGMLDVFGTSIYDYILGYLPEQHKDKADLCYDQFKEIYPSDAMHLMRVFDGVNETLHHLKKNGIRLAVLSCMIQNEVQANLSLLEFKQFDLIYSLECYTKKRPAPDGLLSIMKELNIKPQETIYIGDTPNDIKMAKNAACISVGVKTGVVDNKFLEKENPDHLLDSFAGLKQLISKTD